MWPKIAMLGLAASLVPLGAFAQSNDGGGPPPEVKAKLDAIRSDANAASLAALSPDHRAKVQAIVDSFDADGSTLTIAAAASQIDAVLGKDESQAVLAQQQKMRDAMRSVFADAGAGPGAGGPGAGGPGSGGPGGPGGPGPGGPGGGGPGDGPGGFRGRRRAPDAGRFLLSVDATPDRYRQAEHTERGVSGRMPM